MKRHIRMTLAVLGLSLALTFVPAFSAWADRFWTPPLRWHKGWEEPWEGRGKPWKYEEKEKLGWQKDWGFLKIPRARGPEGQPLISFMLHHQAELGLNPEQVKALEGLRSNFEKEAVRRSTDLKIAKLELHDLLRAQEVDLAKVETKVREITNLQAELRLGRIKTIEQGKALLTPDQRKKLAALLEEPWWAWRFKRVWPIRP